MLKNETTVYILPSHSGTKGQRLADSKAIESPGAEVHSRLAQGCYGKEACGFKANGLIIGSQVFLFLRTGLLENCKGQYIGQ